MTDRHLRDPAKKASKRNEILQIKAIEGLREKILTLENYAIQDHVPETAPPPRSIAVLLTVSSLKATDYRHYMVRKHLNSAKQALTEAENLSNQDFKGFVAKKITDQDRTLQKFIDTLMKTHEKT
jgi:hypothetical protein